MTLNVKKEKSNYGRFLRNQSPKEGSPKETLKKPKELSPKNKEILKKITGSGFSVLS